MQPQQPQQPDDHRNLLIAVLLSMAILLVWQVFFPPPKQPAPDPAATQTGQQVAGEGTTPLAPGTAPGAEGGINVPGSPSTARSQAGSDVKRIAIETPSVTGSLSLTGGRIDDIKLVKYHETVDPESQNVRIFSPANTPFAYFAEQGWVAAGGAKVKTPGRSTVWQAPEGAKLTPGAPVTLTWDNGEGLKFTRKISVDDGYMFDVEDSVTNASGGDVVLYPYARVYRYGTPQIEGFFIQHEGQIGWLGEEGLQELDYSELVEPNGSRVFQNVKGGWIGFTDKYWATAIIPDQSVTYTANMRLSKPAQAGSREAFQTDYLLEGVTVANGAAATSLSRVFVGAKNVELIEGYEEKFGILEFNYLVDWGWFYFITKPLYYLLHWLFGLLGNFGLAILGVTIVVKVIFFPLANKAYKSMAAMKRLQPEMEKLRERFKDDKQRQQQELMALYQKEKINPLAGCLPILLQIPVFFALYKVLFVSIDMRHAPFYGWISDLSAPDPTSIFNLFGLLPYDVPGFLLVGVWPLIMGVTMWLQMQLNPPQPDPTQQMIFNWMPVMFTFLLATFPAGLVIYWAWNNILSLAQQYYIMKASGTEVPLIDNIKKTAASVGNLRQGNNGEASEKAKAKAKKGK